MENELAKSIALNKAKHAKWKSTAGKKLHPDLTIVDGKVVHKATHEYQRDISHNEGRGSKAKKARKRMSDSIAKAHDYSDFGTKF